MKKIIILSSLILLISYNLSAQVYSYQCNLKKEIIDNTPDFTEGNYKFYLDIDNKYLKLDFIGSDEEYNIITYYKLKDDSSVYFKISNVNNSNYKFIISFNHATKVITIYNKKEEVYYFVKEITKIE